MCSSFLKTVFYIGLSFQLISCENKKVAIVERQKVLKKQIDSISFAIERSVKTDNDTTDYTRVLKDKKYLKSSAGRVVEVQAGMFKKQGGLQKEYDSLEMELKKY